LIEGKKKPLDKFLIERDRTNEEIIDV